MFKKIDEKKASDFLDKADLKKTSKRKNRKKSETYVAVYLTAEEKEKILKEADNKGLSASSYIRILLKEKGII